MKKIFSIVSLVFIIGFFGITHNAFAGTLTNFSYSADSYAAGATTNYTISFTNETTVLANGSMILRLLGPGGVTIPNPLTVDVTVDGVSKVPNEIWGGAFGYIRMGEDVPAGSSVVIVLHNIVNTSTPGTYSWSGKVYTADGGANAIDTPASISSLVVTSAPYSGAGAGTALDPYIVTSCSQLIEINNFLDKDFLLNTDLDCTANGNNIMIGSSEGPFTGVFDGGEHTVTINIDNPAGNYVGLFRYISGATIEWLTVGGTIADATSNFIGVIAGVIEGAHIDNVVSSGSATSTGDYVGGMFGQTLCNSLIENSSSSADAYGNDYVGGLSGFDGCEGNGSIIINSNAIGDVSGHDYVGGLIGNANLISTSNVYAAGQVEGNDYVGGFIGSYDGVDNSRKIFHSHAVGNIIGRYYLGGFIGYSNNGIISQSYATGDVLGNGSSDNIGGFMGHTGYQLTIRDSYSIGNPSSAGGGDTGGFIGEGNQLTKISNSYSVGTPSTVSTDGIGGFIGNANSQYITDSFWDLETSGVSSACGNSSCDALGKTTAEMKNITTFMDAGWNLDTVWDVNGEANNGYPYLLGGGDVFDSVAPVIAAVTPITETTTASKAKYYFSTDETCNPAVSEISDSSNGNVTVYISPLPVTSAGSSYVYFTGLTVGATYSLSFTCLDKYFNESNSLDVGPFTVKSSGGGSGSLPVVITNPLIVNKNLSSNPSSSNTSSNIIRTLKLGMTGDDVKALQVYLNTHNYPLALTGSGSLGKETDYFGMLTKNAVIKFQKDHKLDTDGIVGPLTQKELK